MRLKNKFRPKLTEAGSRNRLRRVSGGAQDATPSSPAPAPASTATVGKRLRTPSECKDNNDANAIPAEPPSPAPSPATAAPPSPSPLSPPPPMRQPPAIRRVVSPPPPCSPTNVPMSPPAKQPESASNTPLSPAMIRSRHLSVGSEPAAGIVRQRRLTESSGILARGEHHHQMPASVFSKRKADHKKKFNNGIPERDKMTMFDLIYYNPSNGSRMSTSSSRRTSRASVSSEDHALSPEARRVRPSCDEMHATAHSETIEQVRRRLEEEAADDPSENREEQPEGNNENVGDREKEAEEEGEDSAMPVPQVKVGPNGEMIIDEESTVIETTAARRAKAELLQSPLVFEASSARGSNYGTWGKRRKNVDWTKRETVRFYRALSVFGTDFSMMESVFKKRSRHELKMKFKKEERSNRTLVDKCLTGCGQFDVSAFHSDTEDENEEVEEEEKQRKTRRKRPAQAKGASRGKSGTRGRRTSSNRGYYASSDADESETGGSESDTSKRQTPVQRVSTRHVHQQQHKQVELSQDHAEPCVDPSIASSLHPVVDEPPGKRRRINLKPNVPCQTKSDPTSALSAKSSPLLKSALTETREKSTPTSPHPVFPPNLLAANPSLANAVPGSLLVVASPSQGDPQKQMLQVYRISAAGGDSNYGGGAGEPSNATS